MNKYSKTWNLTEDKVICLEWHKYNALFDIGYTLDGKNIFSWKIDILRIRLNYMNTAHLPF